MQSSRRRLTKKELKEDEVATWLLEAWTYLEYNHKKLIVGLGGLVALIIAVMFFNNHTKNQAQAVLNALGKVHISLMQGNSTTAIEEAEKLIAEFEDQQAIGPILVLLGNLYFEKGRHAEAQAIYQKYLDENGEKGPTGYSAKSGQAACLEAQEDFIDSGEKYLEYAHNHPSSPFTPIAMKEAARCYKLVGNFKMSQEIYQGILKNYSKSPIASFVKTELRQMGIKVY